MTQAHRTSSLCTATAIAAVLALGTTPAIAQDASSGAVPPPDISPQRTVTVELPTLDMNDAPDAIAPAETPQPTIIIPPELLNPTGSGMATGARSESPAPAPRAEEPNRNAAARGVSAGRAVAATSGNDSVTPSAEQLYIGDSASVAASTGDDATGSAVAVAATAGPAIGADTSSASQNRLDAATDETAASVLAGLLGLFGLGGLVIYAVRRRKAARNRAAPVAAVAGTTGETPQTSIPGALTMPLSTDDRHAAGRGGTLVQPGSQAGMHYAESPVVPEGPVPTGEKRMVLIDRMVAARPDKANPFTSPRARRRRARMMLAAREQQLHDDAIRPFDWRTYKPSRRPARESEVETATT
ncbi:MAG: hypothetical protein KDE55_01960 [Novosphingobium sp.]|nr:hypothetical protein [Novosphingobium sp.]